MLKPDRIQTELIDRLIMIDTLRSFLPAFICALSASLISTACMPATTPDVIVPTRASLPDIRTLDLWQEQTSTFADSTSTENWQFFGEAGRDVTLRAVQTGTAPNLVLSLRGAVLAQGSTIQVRLPETEVYRVQVQARQAGTYRIGVRANDQPNPNAPTALPQVVGVPTPTPDFSNQGTYIQRLTAPGDVSGVLSASAPRHVYTLDGQQGQRVTFRLQRIGGTLDPRLTLFAPDGEAISMDDDSGGGVAARLLNIYLPVDGLYSVQVDGQGLFGDYVLGYQAGEQVAPLDRLPTLIPTDVDPYARPATPAPAETDSRLRDHQPVIGTLARPGDFQRFSFVGQAGQSVTVVARPRPDSAVIPQLEIFDPDGALLTQPPVRGSLVPSRAAVAADLTLTQDGTYIIIVTGENNSTGAYTLGYGQGTSIQDVYQGEAAVDQQVRGQIAQVGARHVWQVALVPGDAISLAVSPATVGFDPVVELATADGTVLMRDDNSGGANQAALIRQFNITQPATHLVRVYDASAQATGAYTLLWRTLTAAPTATPPPPSTTILAISDTVAFNAYQFYRFQGDAGQRVQIQVVADEAGFDPVVALLDPFGTVMRIVDDTQESLNPTFTVVLPERGTYNLRVNGYLSSGAFRLTVKLLQ